MVELESAATEVETEVVEIEGGKVKGESFKCDCLEETHIGEFGKRGGGAWSDGAVEREEQRVCFLLGGVCV